MNFTQSELQEQDIDFNNSDNLDAEAFEISVGASDSSISWAAPFHLWVNGQLVATFRSFNGLHNRANLLIVANNLHRVN